MVTEYPISTVRCLVSAADKNRRYELIVQTQSSAVAVIHALDLAFNKGKNKSLQKYQKSLMKSTTKSKNIEEAGNQFLDLIQSMNQGARQRGNQRR